MQKIGIIGLGWIGIPLSKTLIKKGYSIIGTGTSEKPKSEIPKEVDYLPLKLEEEKYTWNSLDYCETMVITIPPSTPNYVIGLKKIIDHFKDKRIILLSSTGVYGNQGPTITEETKTEPQRDGAKKIVTVEEFIQRTVTQYTFVRLAGLVGPKRNPARFFQRTNTVPSPKTTVNLVHQSDAVRALTFLIGLQSLPKTVNVAAPFHPTKGEFYTKIARVTDHETPKIDSQKGEERIVTTSFLDQSGFEFKVKSFYDQSLYP